ncbi:50S ribosomal protein L11 methyltransferase [Acetivibrio cellulolyticus]|uniref:50S ribosomal protein L11 methyltransferase n=1 Tax=Acetivibrio cellulolyticus TaxID=35830 RepID=UPI0001E2C1E5|nr:50S ribosomal protein L11 methyltransferase [Acetivibrio cellulolyticus]
MIWHEVRIKTTEEAYDAVTEMLTSIGAGGVAIEDPNDIISELSKPDSLDYADEEFLSSLEEAVTIKAYFSEEKNISELTSLIEEKLKFISQFLNVGEGFVGTSQVDDEDWSTSWKKYYKPLNLTDKLVIKPSWESYEKKNDEIVVEMDPGMAFGTGTHETTQMCSILLEKYVKPGDKVIDLGCGTGILSIIAAKLGAEAVTAVDIDEVAVKVAKENCAINGVDGKVSAFRGVIDDLKKEKADIIVANIIANVIIDISSKIPSYLKKDGLFVTSGIIKERSQEVLEAYTKLGFKCEQFEELGEWVAIVFRCLDSL